MIPEFHERMMESKEFSIDYQNSGTLYTGA